MAAETQLFFGPALRGLDENLLLVHGSASYFVKGFVPLTVPCSATMVLGNFAWRRVCWGECLFPTKFLLAMPYELELQKAVVGLLR